MESPFHGLGIDFGTCFSCVQLYRNNQPTPIKETEKANSIRSLVTLYDRSLTFGMMANANAHKQHALAFPNVKTVVGRMNDDLSVYRSTMTPYEITFKDFPNILRYDHMTGSPIIVSPQYVIALFLWNILQQIPEWKKVDMSTVLTAPAQFNFSQIHALREAADLAGLKLAAIIPEPVAAALRYANINNNQLTNIIVYDLGGGTFDVSVVHHKGNDYHILGFDGSPNIGGLRFDYRLYEVVGQKLSK